MFKKNYSDEELVTMIKKGGQAQDRAVRFLMRRNDGKITRLVTQHNGSIEDAQDVFQEGMVELIFSIFEGRYNHKSALDTFLYRICRFIWYKKYNKKIRDKKLLEELKREDDIPAFTAMDSAVQQILQNLSKHLGSDCMQIFYLSASNYSSEEIARLIPSLNSAQAVMNKKYKCRKKLGQLIEEDPKVSDLIRELRFQLENP